MRKREREGGPGEKENCALLQILLLAVCVLEKPLGPWDLFPSLGNDRTASL